MSTKLKIFLSHSSKDKPLFDRLFQRVDPDKIWLDSHELELGDALPAEIGQAVDESGAFIFLLSKNSLKSNWVKYELNMALVKYLEGAGYRIIVVRIDSSNPPLAVKPFLRIDEPDNAEKAIDALADFINEGSIWAEEQKESDRQMFINRADEKQQIEDYSNEGAKIVLISGAFGYGKTALAVNTASSVFGKTHELFRLTAAHQPKRLALELAARAKIELPDPNNTDEQDINYALNAISAINNSGRLRWSQKVGQGAKVYSTG